MVKGSQAFNYFKSVVIHGHKDTRALHLAIIIVFGAKCDTFG